VNGGASGDSVALAHRDLGGDGPHVVLLHGLGRIAKPVVADIARSLPESAQKRFAPGSATRVPRSSWRGSAASSSGPRTAIG